MSDILVVEPRLVPLGDPGDITVSRVLPRREVSLVGGWCFLDHFGPDSTPMRVAPHPHTCLQTVTWLFSGELRHADALGTDILVRPGEVNLMTAGRGISHTEYSVPGAVLHGVQLWTALPDAARFVAPHFEHFVPEPARMGDHEVALFVGDLGWESSPVRVYSPMLGAEIRFASEEPLVLDLHEDWEYAVLVDAGDVVVEGTPVPPGHLAYLPPGRSALRLTAVASAESVARVVLIGGEPLGEDIVMWWNFVARSHEEVTAFRAEWQAAIGAGSDADPGRFQPVVARTDDEPEIPAPSLPPVRLRPRSRNRPRPPTGQANSDRR